MKKNTINDAISAVMKEKAIPLTSREIYETIIEKKYYQFNSKNAIGVVSNQLRRHSEGNVQSKNREILYRRLPDGSYEINKQGK